MDIKIELLGSDESFIPEKSTHGASGYDVRSTVSMKISSRQRVRVPLGFKIEIPCGYEAQIRPRSGISHKEGLIATFGTIDSDYRGECHAAIVNHSDSECEIKKGDRVAQMVFSPVIHPDIINGSVSESQRGDGGFGSTGK